MSDTPPHVRFAPWVVVAWIVLFSVGVVLEAAGLWSTVDNIPPLTQVTTRYVPEVLILSGIGWMGVHFVQSYRSERNQSR